MLVLAIDSSTTSCSAAVVNGDNIVAQMLSEANQNQSALIVPMIDRILQTNRINLAKINAIAVTTGPGSFTGLRIGVAAAKGLALALDLPLIGLSCFDVITHRAFKDLNVSRSDLLVITVTSKRRELYWRCIDSRNNLVINDQASIPSLIVRKLLSIRRSGTVMHFIGPGSAKLAEFLHKTYQPFLLKTLLGPQNPPLASDVAFLAADEIQQTDKPLNQYRPGLVPNYLGRSYFQS